MADNFASIPTKYNGTQFRSRLEAKWAAFFDLLGWKWEYEPIDLNGYIPDFILSGFPDPLLVEVKPCLTVDEMRSHADKTINAGWEEEFVIVGSILIPRNEWTALGIFCNSQIGGWDHAIVTTCSGPNKGFAIFEEEQSFRCRHCGFYDGGCYVGEPFEIDEYWRAAGNVVQWHPSKDR